MTGWQGGLCRSRSRRTPSVAARPPRWSWRRERGRTCRRTRWRRPGRSSERRRGPTAPNLPRELQDQPAVRDGDRVDRQRLVGGRIQRLARREVEPREVERAGQRAVGEESLVQLEVLVAADALDGVVGDVEVDHEDLSLIHISEPT